MSEESDEQDEALSLKALLRDGGVTERAELGFEVDVKRVDDVLRGHYDISRLQRDHPQLVNLVTWLLSLPGMTIQAIAQASGIAWESVAAIQAANKKPIREFKLRAADRLSLVLDASFGGLMKRAADGKITAFDFKLLVDAWLQLSGEGHTMKFEGAKPADPKRDAFRRFLESGSGMVLEAESIPQTADSPPAALPAPARPQIAGFPSVPGDSESLSSGSQIAEYER